MDVCWYGVGKYCLDLIEKSFKVFGEVWSGLLFGWGIGCWCVLFVGVWVCLGWFDISWWWIGGSVMDGD